MKTLIAVLVLLLGTAVPLSCLAAPNLATPTTENVRAGIATLVLQSNGTGAGYFTLLNGSATTCGTGTQVKAGQTSTGATAPYHGSLPLTANTNGRYTVRNLTQSTAYTICFTADSPSGSNLQAIPSTANLNTPAATDLTGADWRTVGRTGFSNQAEYISLAIAPDGTPYVAFEDWGNDAKATVMKFNGTSWGNMGQAGFSTGQVNFTSLAFAPDGSPYVAYVDFANSNKATVMKFNGTSWVNVGRPGFTAEEADHTSLAFAPDGTPYVAYGDWVGSDVGATVMKFNGMDWVNVGGGDFSAGFAGHISLAIAPDGSPYVAYEEYYDNYVNHYGATVMKFNGARWVNVGVTGFSADRADFPSLAFAPDGSPYVAYVDFANSNKVTVMKFNGTSWILEGIAGFSDYPVLDSLSLAVAPDGSPYVAYQQAEGVDRNKATVMKYSGGAWNVVGSSGFSADDAGYLSLVFALDGNPYVAYEDWDNGYGVTVKKLMSTKIATTCLFDWAERNYPALFAPANSPTAVWSDYTYRYYSATGAYLGVSSADNHVYYQGPDGKLQDVGPLSNWLPKAGCEAPPPPPSDCLFNWAERNYPALFAPSGSPTAVWTIYTYRYYSATNVYLAVSSADNHVYYQGVDGKLLDEGPLSNWLPLAGCQ